MSDSKRERAAGETLEIPASVRNAVDERDKGICKVCGTYLGPERRAIHHIRYGGDYVGMGGRRKHIPEEMITVGWLPGEDCHTLVHSNKGLWQPLLLVAAVTPGVTCFQLRRWQRAAQRRTQ